MALERRYTEDNGWQTVEISEATPEVFGFAVHWSNISGWTLGNGNIWQTTDEPVTIDRATAGFNDPGNLPFWVPSTPAVGGAGLYLLFAAFVFGSSSDGGFVGANVAGSTRGTIWAPCIAAQEAERQTLAITHPLDFGDGDNTMDVANFLNYSGHNVTLYRADYLVQRIAV